VIVLGSHSRSYTVVCDSGRALAAMWRMLQYAGHIEVSCIRVAGVRV
jgi:hypothetical protein